MHRTSLQGMRTWFRGMSSAVEQVLQLDLKHLPLSLLCKDLPELTSASVYTSRADLITAGKQGKSVLDFVDDLLRLDSFRLAVIGKLFGQVLSIL